MSALPFKSVEARERYLARYVERARGWPVPSEEHVVPTSFGQTFVRLSGPVGAPPLLMLPGIGSDGLSLSAVAGLLSKHRRTVVIDNIHDAGRSVESRPVTNGEDFAAWLDEVRKGLGLEQVDLLGLSYGGWISAQYALRFPQAVRRVVLLSPAGTVAPIPFGFIWRALLCYLPGRRWMHGFMAYASPVLAEATDAPSRALLDAFVDDALLSFHSFAPRRMVEPRPPTEADWGRFTTPALFLAGEREVFFDPTAAVALLGRVAPSVECTVFPGAGHDLFLVRAADVAARVEAFLGAPA